MEAADTFARESGTPPGLDLSAITDRMEIRKAVQSGNVDFAVDRVNELSPEVSMVSGCGAPVACAWLLSLAWHSCGENL